uniref:Uncharacterized protein n=2 Tax=Tetradesmus obliquus TaxID=3088 RepID=A0A383W3S3_TETOB|eukprot:jgi/Sobl393_1/6190/SZX72121.1
MHARASGSSSSSSKRSSSRHALSSLTSLTSLVLEDVRLQDPVGLGGLSALTGLHELHLDDIRKVMPSGPPQQEASHEPRTPDQMRELREQEVQQYLMWQQELRQDVQLGLGSLMQLTRLVLDPYLLPEEAHAPLSCLQQLQELKFCGSTRSPGEVLRLPLSLTKVELEWDGEEALSSSLCPGLAALTNLQHLGVCGYHDDEQDAPGLLPDFCSDMQQLRVLKLHGVLSRNALPALAQVLPTLSCLESLLVHNARGELAPLPASGVAGYLALPLSPHITHLELSWGHAGSDEEDAAEAAILHSGCGQHLFAAGRQLPQLKQLLLGVPAETLDSEDVDGYASQVSYLGGGLGEGSLPRWVTCCPGLELLWIAGLLEPGEDMRPLLQLTALTELFVGGGAVTNDAACEVLSQLSSLRSLGVFAAEQFNDTGLLALTALRQLTQLAVAGCKISAEVETDSGDYHGGFLVLQQQEALPPVWLQLLDSCVRSKHRTQLDGESCGELALQQLMALQTGAQERVARLEQRLAAAEATLAARGKQADAGASQQQLAAAELRAAELEQRLAAAEAKLAAAEAELAA